MEELNVKLWVDKSTPAPEGYFWCKDAYTAIEIIKLAEYICSCFGRDSIIEFIDVYGKRECIDLLMWMDKNEKHYPIDVSRMSKL